LREALVSVCLRPCHRSAISRDGMRCGISVRLKASLSSPFSVINSVTGTSLSVATYTTRPLTSVCAVEVVVTLGCANGVIRRFKCRTATGIIWFTPGRTDKTEEVRLKTGMRLWTAVLSDEINGSEAVFTFKTLAGTTGILSTASDCAQVLGRAAPIQPAASANRRICALVFGFIFSFLLCFLTRQLCQHRLCAGLAFVGIHKLNQRRVMRDLEAVLKAALAPVFFRRCAFLKGVAGHEHLVCFGFVFDGARLKAQCYAVVQDLLDLRVQGIHHLVIDRRREQRFEALLNKADGARRHVARQLREKKSPRLLIGLSGLGSSDPGVLRERDRLHHHNRFFTKALNRQQYQQQKKRRNKRAPPAVLGACAFPLRQKMPPLHGR